MAILITLLMVSAHRERAGQNLGTRRVTAPGPALDSKDEKGNQEQIR
jgi:hypothetical protein